MSTSSNSYSIDSVLRALDTLEYLSRQGGTGRVSDIAEAIDCSKNTAFRILQSLQERDYVRQASDSSYELTLKLLSLGEAVLRNTDLHTVARPQLGSLVQEFGETASLGRLDGHDIVYLDRVLGNKPYHTSFSVGSRAKAHSTSLGKAILAFAPRELVDEILSADLEPSTEYSIIDPEKLRMDLKDTAERGYAIDNEENVVGIRCLGAPVFNRAGEVVAAVSVAALSARMSDDYVNVVARRLLAAADTISARLGYTKP